MLERFFKPFPSQNQNKKEVPLPPKNNQLLPNQIGGRILDLQMQCEKQTISKDLVFQLLGEYTKAVQFYEEQGNDKYKLYQKRMHNFLAKPMIQSILKGQSGQMIIKKQRKQETIRKAQNNAEQQVKQLLQKQQQKQKKHTSFIQQQLTKQQQVLEQRIRKKRTLSNRSIHSQPEENSTNNQQSGKKPPQRMNVKLMLLDGIGTRTNKDKKVYL